MSNFTDFFPVAAGGGDSPLITDPNLLPKIIGRGVLMKIGITSLVYTWQNQSQFYTNQQITQIGSLVQITPSPDHIEFGPYNTICDLTGSGEFYSAISSIADLGSGRVINWKFTVDGIETIIEASIDTNQQMYIGNYIPTQVSDSYSNAIGYGTAMDSGASSGMSINSLGNFLNSPGQSLGFLRYDAYENMNLITLKFESSYKLEYRTTDLTQGQYNKYVYAMYKLNS